MTVFSEQRILRGRDRERVASEHDLALEADTECEHVNFGNDDATDTVGPQRHSVGLWG